MSRSKSEPVRGEPGNWQGWTQYRSGSGRKTLYGPLEEELHWAVNGHGWGHAGSKSASTRPWMARTTKEAPLRDRAGRIRTFETAEAALRALRKAKAAGEIGGAQAPARPSTWSGVVRHKKRGSEYEVTYPAAEVQISTRPLVEGDKVTVYVGRDGKVWVRLQSEFDDGRFEAVE